MTVARVLLSALALVTAAPVAAAASLDALLAFEKPALCRPGPAFQRLINSVMRFRIDGDTVVGSLSKPVVPRVFRGQFGTPTLAVAGNSYAATVPVAGTWQGLPLRALIVTQIAESEGGFALAFDASPAAVRAAANRAGFALGADGRDQLPDMEGLQTYIAVVAVDGGAELSCTEG